MRRPRSSLAPRRRQSPPGSSGRARRSRAGWNRPRRRSKGVEADPMPDENDIPLTDEELARAREGQALIAAAVADVHAPQTLREAIERDRERAAKRARAPFWRRHRLALVPAGAAVVALAVAAIAIQTSENPAEPSLTKVYA